MARGKKKNGASNERPGQADPTAPLDGGELLATARPVLQLLREDLGKRAEDVRVDRALRTRYEDEKTARRTADSFGAWRDGLLAQVAASWFLSCVFVRTLEDRGLLGSARLAGPGAPDSQTLFFQLAPSLTERDYLLFVFRELAELPAARALFDREHAMVWQLSPSADAAKELLRLFRTPSAEAPAFRFGQPSTRFLGDLYQDLYEDVRKRYALLQTPDFIESFILDRTLEPAIERFGLDDTTLIDPTCGSGHFLLGAFDRLFEHRLRAKPGIDVRQAAHQALDAVYGADINPYAVAIARVRLTLSYLEKAGVGRLKDAPALPLHLVVADSLLYNPQHAQLGFEHQQGQSTAGWRAEAFQPEDPVAARDVLHRRYAAVVGNPPYITEKDSAKRETYRAMYPRSAAGKYALSAPFCERFFQLARERGLVGQITANSFMKREFGKKLIEEYLKKSNLEVIVNTSGAYIPSHGTPTVLLFGTHEPPVRRDVLTILAKRGEPSTPANPARGAVWASIAEHWRDLGFDNDYITVANTDRDKLATHPWSLGGGGALELKELLEDRAKTRLGEIVEDIGFASFPGLDDAFVLPAQTARTLQLESHVVRPMVTGESVRDWAFATDEVAIAPYDTKTHQPIPLVPDSVWGRFLWPYRVVANNVSSFGGKTREQEGQNWWQWYRWQIERYSCRFRIAFAFVASHNHFVLDRGGKVFKQTAPIIKLAATASEDDHLALLTYLNSSTACFWMKQVCMLKGTQHGSEANSTPYLAAYEFDSSKLAQIPLPPGLMGERRSRYAAIGRLLDDLTVHRSLAELRMYESDDSQMATLESVCDAVVAYRSGLLERMIALQEDADWLVYEDFGLVANDPTVTPPATVAGLKLGERPFEIRLGKENPDSLVTGWFRWHGSKPATSPPALPAAQGRQYERRLELASAPELRLLECEDSKRRWIQVSGKAGQVLETEDKVVRDRAREWLWRELDVLCNHLAPFRGADVQRNLLSAPRSSACASWLFGAAASDMIIQHLETNSVPYLAAMRFSATGMATFRIWEQTWSQQRAKDLNQHDPHLLPSIPPKYSDRDYTSMDYYRLRGRLDVPKERFISYPGCESDEDGEPVYGWAGWNHLKRVQALASLYQKRKTDEGWTAERLTPMLAGLLELLPWLKQWHNEPDAEFDGQRMGDFFTQFLDGECQALGLTHADLEAWRPTKKPAARKKAAVATAQNGMDDEPVKPKRARKKKAAVTEATGDAPSIAPPKEPG
jgi:hypothetical protein